MQTRERVKMFYSGNEIVMAITKATRAGTAIYIGATNDQMTIKVCKPSGEEKRYTDDSFGESDVVPKYGVALHKCAGDLMEDKA